MCSGNICRSPMAEVIAADYARRRGREIAVGSAGTLGLEGRPADPHAVAVCRELGLDLTGHVSRGVTRPLLDEADHVLVMAFEHARWIRERHPEVGEKLLLLGTFGSAVDIPDPIGGFRFRFRRVRDEIRRCVELFVDRLPAGP